MDYRFDTSTIIQCIQIALVGEEIAPQSEEQKKNANDIATEKASIGKKITIKPEGFNIMDVRTKINT